MCGVSYKITECVHNASISRDIEISYAACQCDLAFIDGSHLMPDIERDFRLCAPCRKIIMHDYWINGENWPDVKSFVDSLTKLGYYDGHRVFAQIHPPFAYVELLD